MLLNFKEKNTIIQKRRSQPLQNEIPMKVL